VSALSTLGKCGEGFLKNLITAPSFTRAMLHARRLMRSKLTLALLTFAAGGIATPILSKIANDAYVAAFPDKEYSILIDTCAPLKSARVILKNLDTDQIIGDKKVEWMNETTVVVKNLGKKSISKPVISINALPFGTEKIEPLFALIYSSSVEMARKASITRTDSFFRIELDQMNPDDFLWLEANFTTPISYLIELYGLGVTKAQARPPGCTKNTKRNLLRPPSQAAQAFSYVSQSCKKVDEKLECSFRLVEVPFNIPGDAAPGARLSDQYIIERD
jgi:hypothetical protein